MSDVDVDIICQSRYGGGLKSLFFLLKVPLYLKKEVFVDFVVTLYITSLCFNALHSDKVSQKTFLCTC